MSVESVCGKKLCRRWKFAESECVCVECDVCFLCIKWLCVDSECVCFKTVCLCERKMRMWVQNVTCVESECVCGKWKCMCKNVCI